MACLLSHDSSRDSRVMCHACARMYSFESHDSFVGSVYIYTYIYIDRLDMDIDIDVDIYIHIYLYIYIYVGCIYLSRMTYSLIPYIHIRIYVHVFS